MKKLLLSLTILLAPLVAWAEAGFYVTTTSGNRVSFVFSEQPVWTYEGENLVVSTLDSSIEFPMSEVDLIYFDDAISTSLTDVRSDEMIRIVHDGIELSGFAANTIVIVHNLQGRQMGSYHTDAAGSLNLNLDGFDQGIYIIQANKSTIKIKK